MESKTWTRRSIAYCGAEPTLDGLDNRVRLIVRCSYCWGMFSACQIEREAAYGQTMKWSASRDLMTATTLRGRYGA